MNQTQYPRPMKMIRAQTPQPLGHALEPGRFVRPLIGIDGCGDAEPDGIALMTNLAMQSELTLEHARSAGCVNDPATGHREGLAAALCRYVEGLTVVNDLAYDGIVQNSMPSLMFSSASMFSNRPRSS